MSLVLGVVGIPKVEVELLRIIVRLSSNLRTTWTVSESGNCDVLLVDSATPVDAWHAPSAPFVVVPMVQRGQANAPAPAIGRTLARPIFAEELVDLLNEMTAGVRKGKTAAGAGARSARDRASLIRWPAQITMQRNPVYLRLAAALSKSAQSAESLSALSRVDVDECSTFMGLLEQEGVLAWSPDAGARGAMAAMSAMATEDARQRTGLLSRIRRRLGLA
jgi:hypothetical protein